MLKLISVVLLLCAAGAASSFEHISQPGQTGADALKHNNCVGCHSLVSNQAGLSTKFLEWRVSPHAPASVGCERCHGGDPIAKDAKQAHRGIFPPSDARSLLSGAKVADTCGACHQAIARSFVESPHYQRLKTSGMGPSCSSCHAHMGASVRKTSSEAESLCTYCHNTQNGVLPPRPDIPADSKAVIDAIQRTQYMLTWIDSLLTEADKQNIAVNDEKNEASNVKASLQGVQIAWHTFNLTGVMEMANKTFIKAAEVKDRLNKKVHHD
ncbi:MAG TPA: multiheme c-type cytochrome [Blastocatellia bacterium]|nr:multiheme c-type cytochrome [Blastocatellia bacterium]